MKLTVLILTGLPGCGKTTASSFFEEKKIPVVRMGKVTDEALFTSGLKYSPINEKKIREDLRRKFGEDIYARKTVEKILPLLKNNSLVVVDGMRSEEEYVYFKKNLPEVDIIFIETSQAIRYQRLTQRIDRPLSEEEAQKRDISELTRLGLHTLRKSADFIIHNDGSKSELYTELEKILKDLRARSSR